MQSNIPDADQMTPMQTRSLPLDGGPRISMKVRRELGLEPPAKHRTQSVPGEIASLGVCPSCMALYDLQVLNLLLLCAASIAFGQAAAPLAISEAGLPVASGLATRPFLNNVSPISPASSYLNVASSNLSSPPATYSALPPLKGNGKLQSSIPSETGS